MTTREIELKALMLASLDGDAASHRALLEQLSRRLRAYYKGKLALGGAQKRRKTWFRKRYWRSTSSGIPTIPLSP
jgi:ATP-dependent protease HslVU (ClpYQ) peptidase subunit